MIMKQCISDMLSAAERGRISLEEQVRAYDFLDSILETGTPADADAFCKEYESLKERLESVFDADALSKEADEHIAPLHSEMNEARFAAAAAASLHEFAKEVFRVWQTSGIFARRRALRELRERAGFRLESHRIGNYVAKTYDLMNEAQARFARAQQALFASDVRYKIRKDIYTEIYDAIQRKG